MAREQEEQEQRKSSVDRVNDFINRAQDVRKNAQRIQKSVQALRGGAQVAQGTAAAAQGAAAAGGATTTTAAAGVGTAAGGGTVILIATIVILLIIIIASVFIIFFVHPSGQPDNPLCTGRCAGPGNSCDSATESADLTGGACSDGSKCCQPKVELSADCAQYSNDPVTGLKAVFNVVASGGSTNDYTRLFSFFCDAARAPSYKTLLTNGGRVLNVALNSSDRDPCAGYTPWGQNLIKLGPWTCGAGNGNLEHLVIHESGHVIAYRNPRLYTNDYPYGNLILNDGSACYEDGYLRTYSLRCGKDCNIEPKDESFAESVGEYVTYKISYTGGNKAAINIPDFPNTCAFTYSWFRHNVFGDFIY